MDVTDIEKRVEKAIAAPTPVHEIGGVRLENLGQVMEFAKLMAVSGVAVPKWLRNNPGGCLAICSRALRWEMDPFAVAEQSYLAIGKGGIEHIGFQSQLIHAVITAHAPLKGRLRSEIIGAGDDRRCRVSGTFKGESKPHEYTSETLAKKIATIGRNEKGQIKGSPLWETDPEVQLTYSAVRQWCRLHSSETILGVYTPDELEAAPEAAAVSTLAQRLRDAKLAHAGERGFDAGHVAKVIEGEATEADDDENRSGTIERPMADTHERDGDPNQKRGAVDRQESKAPRKNVARQDTTRKESAREADLFPRDHAKQGHKVNPQPPPKGKRR
jgi:RecT family